MPSFPKESRTLYLSRTHTNVWEYPTSPYPYLQCERANDSLSLFAEALFTPLLPVNI